MGSIKIHRGDALSAKFLDRMSIYQNLLLHVFISAGV